VRPCDPRIDASVAIEFKETLAELVADGHRKIIFDLEEVDFMDSTGLSAVVCVLKLVGAEGFVALSSPGETVLSLLKLTQMDKVFAVYSKLEDALAMAT